MNYWEKYPEFKDVQPGDPRKFIRKAQYNFGWDWGPKLACSGLWRRVRLEAYENRLEDVHYSWNSEEKRLRVTVDVCGEISDKPDCFLSLENDKLEVAENVVEGKSIHYDYVIEKPELWWPVGMGEPNLYKLRINLNDKVGDHPDIKDLNVGLRTIELDTTPDEQGSKYALKVNGKHVFCKGSNLIPGDSFITRHSLKDYERDIELALASNHNTLRIWGGGIYEQKIFFSLCDEKGILVLHDFMFACSVVPEIDELIETVKGEVDYQVRRMRRHPCLALLAGNNENYMLGSRWWKDFETFPGRLYYEKIIPEICEKLVPEVPYVRSSPYGRPENKGVQETGHGDMHNWNVWHGGVSFEGYRDCNGRFISEFGMQSAPSIQTIEKYMVSEETEVGQPVWPDVFGDVMLRHQRCGYGQEKVLWYMNVLFGQRPDFEDFVYLSQTMQGMFLTAGIEHWRSRWKDQGTSGAVIWQANDCWPVVSWALYDYEQRPKGSWYFIKRVFQPLLICAKPANFGRRGQIPLHLTDFLETSFHLVNDTMEKIEGEVKIETLLFNGEQVNEIKLSTVIEPNTSLDLGVFSGEQLKVSDPSIMGLRMSFVSENHSVKNDYFFKPDRNLKLQEPDVALDINEDGSIVIQTDTLIRHLILVPEKPDAIFNDNFMTIWPDEKISITNDIKSDLTGYGSFY